MTALTDQLRIAFQEGEKQGRKGEQLKIATDSRGGNQWDDMSGYGSDWPGTMKDQMKDEPGTDPAEIFEQLELPLDTVKRLKELMIAGGVLLPGETPSGGKGGLGSMNKNQLERWIKENGITGPGADKIRNKWKNLGPNLPLAHNMKPGPASGIADQIMIQQQKLYNSGKPGDKKKALELLKIHADMINLPKA